MKESKFDVKKKDEVKKMNTVKVCADFSYRILDRSVFNFIIKVLNLLFCITYVALGKAM